MSDALHIVRLVLDRRAVLRVGARHHLARDVDEGSLLHAGLAQLFATSAERAEVPLHNFAVDDLQMERAEDPTALFVLAYSATDDVALQSAMGPSHRELLRVCRSNPLPEFEPGQRLGFRTRVCPIVRTRIPGDRALGTDRRGKVKPREMDVFVHATLVAPEERLDRAVIYAKWLRRELERDGAAACELDDLRLTRFKREALRRRGRDRMERPDALMEGTLTVRDPGAFRALLARGIGRHRAFGFGMLLLRPPAR